LDRDGVINHEIGYLHKIKDCVFIDGVFDSLKELSFHGYEFIIISNQSGIGRGFYTLEDFKILNSWMLSKFSDQKITILETFYCPHTPSDNCLCRKPNAKMFKDAQRKYNVKLSESWSIGDKLTDIEASIRAGIRNNILVRSGHKIPDKTSRFILVANSIVEAKDLIIS